MLNRIDLSRTDLNLLVLFDVVMEERNVGRAAARLSLTASAVSHGLGRLRRLLNDPLFLRTPKGVVPSDRALALAPAIAGILAEVRGVMASAEPFDPATSRRRFTIGAPDAVVEVLIRGLLERLAQSAPGIDIGLRQTLVQGRAVVSGWGTILADLERRAMDIAIVPLEDVPARFRTRTLYEEDFVAVCASGHPFAATPSLDVFCAARHLLVSAGGDPHGFVDEALARMRRGRRVALTVPNFMMGLTLVAETDLIAAMPRHLAALYADGHGLAVRELPLPVSRYPIRVVVPEAALMDAGIAWLFDAITVTPDGRPTG